MLDLIIWKKIVVIEMILIIFMHIGKWENENLWQAVIKEFYC